MAYAEKRGKGEYPWRVKYKRPDGTEASASGFATKQDALEHGRDQEAAGRAGTWIDPKAGEITLEDWWGEWLPAQDYRPRTVDTYTQHWNRHIRPKWGRRALGDIRGLEMKQWLKELHTHGGLSSSAVHVISSALRAAFDDAVFDDRIGRSPMPPKRRGARTKSAEEEKREGVVIRFDEAAAILERLHPGAERLMLLIALFTGMRWSEVCAMDRKHLELAAGPSLVPGAGSYTIDPKVGAVHETPGKRRYAGPPKSGPGRILDLPPFLVLLLAAYLESIPAKQQILFPDKNGNWRSHGVWNTGRWRQACDGRAASVSKTGRVVREAVLPVHKGLRFHDAKHTHKAMLNDMRVHPVLQDYRLGHKAKGSGAAYSHPTVGMRRECVDALERIWQECGLTGALQAPEWGALGSGSPKLLPIEEPAALGMLF